MPKLPDIDNDCNTASLILASLLTAGRDGEKATEGLDSTAGCNTEAAVTAGFLLRFPAKDFLYFRYSCIDSTDQSWHSLQRESIEHTTSLQCEQIVWESCLRLLILR